MRLIDADALKENLKLPEESGRMGELLEMVIHGAIDDAPTIEERKTGTWIRTEKHYKDPEQEFYYYEEHCSECGVERKIGWRDASYCPNCGAKMS